MTISGIRESASIQYIPGLDGVRAIAIIMVMIFHFTGGFIPMLSQLGSFWEILARVSNVGWVGVDIFFVISGFLITRVLTAKPINSFSKYWRFISRRVRRLVPAYVVCLVVFGVVALIFAPDSKVLKNQYLLWTLTSNIESSFGDRVALGDLNFSLVHFWSLAVEWHFYLLYPLVLAALRTPTRSAVVLISAAIACRTVFFALGFSDNATFSFSLCRIDSLAIGSLLAVWSSVFSPTASNRIAACGALSFLALMVSIGSTTWLFKSLAWLQTIGYSAIAISVAMMLLGLINAQRKSWTIILLEQPWITAIGRSSYSLYIWHLVFFPTIARTVGKHVEGGPIQYYLLTFVISVLITAILGTASYLLVEARFIRPSSGSVAAHA